MGAPNSPYVDQATHAAQTYGVPAQILWSVVTQESGWNANVPNGTSGEVGMTQILPSTAAGLGISDVSALKNPATAFDAAARLLAQLYARFGNWYDAVEAYNGSGPNATKYADAVYGRAVNQYGFNPNSTTSNQTSGVLPSVSDPTIGGGGLSLNPNLNTSPIDSGAQVTWGDVDSGRFLTAPGTMGPAAPILNGPTDPSKVGQGDTYTPSTGNPIEDALNGFRDNVTNSLNHAKAAFLANLPAVGIGIAGVVIIGLSLAYLFKSDAPATQTKVNVIPVPI